MHFAEIRDGMPGNDAFDASDKIDNAGWCRNS